MAAAALPAGARVPATANLEVETCRWFWYGIGEDSHDHGRDLVRLKGLHELFGHDGTRHVGSSVGGNGVDVNVVFGALAGKSTGEAKNAEFLGLSVESCYSSGVELTAAE